jgi:hypothetical protein
MKNYIILLFLCSSFSFSTFAQIESGKTKQKGTKTKEKPKKIIGESEKTNLVSFSYIYGESFRNFKITDKDFEDNFSFKKEEKAIKTSNFYLELQSPLKKNFFASFGIGHQIYGENYNFISDTSLSYTTKYTHLAIPLKIGFETKSKVQFFASTGIQAQMLYSYKRSETVKIGDEETITNFKKENYTNLFTLTSVSTLGIRYSISNINIGIAGDYFYQLNSSFQKQKGYTHHPWFYGIRFSLGYKFN